MLKKKLIPTPLAVHSTGKGRPPKPIKRFRVFYIFKMLLRVVWFLAMRRLRRPAGPGGKYTYEALGMSITASFERLGGLWIKAAQIIAMRRDILPKEFCDHLSRLHDRAHGFPGAEACRIIEEDLGRPIDEVFKHFETEPIAAASIGQVHIGWLRESGVKVAVKVQRPNIVDSFRQDLSILRGYFTLLRLFRFMTYARWEEMFETLQQTLVEELDYRLEVASMRRMRRTLKQEGIYAPKAFTQYCTKRVLTMEYLDGVLMSDYIHVLVNEPARAKAWCKENKIKPKKFGRRLYLSMIKQIFEDNLLHADLHPGNIMMLRKSRVAYIDFGTVSILDAGLLTKYNLALRALWRKDFSKYADAYFTMVPGIPVDVDLDMVRKEMIRDMERWESLTDVKGVPYDQRSLTALNAAITSIIGRYKFPPEWAILRLLRTMTALDASFRFVIPDIDFYKVMNRFYAAQRIRVFKRMASKRVREDISVAVNDLMKVPPMLAENMIFQADLIRKRAMSFQAGLSKAAAVGKALVGTLLNLGLIATVFIVARYASRHHDVGKSAMSQLPVRDVFASMPSLSPGMWLIVIVLSVYLLRSLMKLGKVLGVTGVGTNPFLNGSGS